ncbi:MAG TPA: CHAP domain-containing protein [Candidatus Dormibacteraeota bacterium]
MHAVVLLIALVVSGFATSDRVAPWALRLGAINAEGLVGSEGGSVGTVSLGRTSTILKPIALPTAAPRSRAAVVYTVAEGDSVTGLAGRFGVSQESIRWSNFDALKQVDQDVAQGQQVLIPPVTGVAVRVVEGDTAASLAARYHVDEQAVVDFNYLRDPEHLTRGEVVVVPGGTGPDFVQPPPPPVRVVSAPPRAAAPSAAVSTVTHGGPAAGGAGGNRFAYGYCTWYVASRRPVPWLGDAWQWYGQAQAYGWATGKTPRPGAIMVTGESGWGHVAIVESVNPDGSWRVSEMNFVAWGVISQRTIKPGTVPLQGFIY